MPSWAVAGTLLFGQLSAVCFLLARRLATDAEWRGWTPGTMATGVIVAAFYVGTVVVASIDQGATGPAGWHGLLQRIAFFSGFAWLALVASRLSAISSSVGERARR